MVETLARSIGYGFMRCKWFLAATPNHSRPIVVLLAWVRAKEYIVERYVGLYNSLGWDVCVFYIPYLAMWLPLWAQQNALTVVNELQRTIAKDGPRPIVFTVYSGSLKGCYYKLLNTLNNATAPKLPYEALRGCIVGEIFDSTPIDFTSNFGVNLAAPGNKTLQQQLQRHCAVFAAGCLDFFLVEWFERQRADVWKSLAENNLSGATLFIYSWNDPLINASKVHALAAAARDKGKYVIEQSWLESTHVGHLRDHPEEYIASVKRLLELSLDAWRERNASQRSTPAKQTNENDVHVARQTTAGCLSNHILRSRL